MGSGGPSGLQKRPWGKSILTIFPLLDRILLIFLAFTNLDGFITIRLD
jgi:hypothetical protein